jgi:hypothetical protein
MHPTVKRSVSSPMFWLTWAFTLCQRQNILAHNVFSVARIGILMGDFFLSQQQIPFVRGIHSNCAGWQVVQLQNGVVQIWTFINWKRNFSNASQVASVLNQPVTLSWTLQIAHFEFFKRAYKFSKVRPHKCIFEARKWTLRSQLRCVNTQIMGPKLPK